MRISFDTEEFSAVRKPLREARTLPNWCYTAEEFYRLECERIFSRNWQFVCRIDEISERGKYFVYDGVGGSVIVMRSGDDAIKAYANSCRHRGTRLLSGSGQCLRIVCPYHSWIYDIEGGLLNSPGMEGLIDFDPGDYSLVELPCQVWQGFVFISFDSNPPTLDNFLGNMPEMFEQYRLGEMVCVRRSEYEIECNWKLLAENALEAYHTGTVHRDTLGQQKARPVSAKGNWGGIFVEGEESVATMPGADKPMPHIAGLSGDSKAGTYFTMIYPCTQFVMAQDCMWWLDFTPKNPSRTHLTLGLCFPQSTVDAGGFEEKVKPYFHRLDTATPEDNAICEAQQLGQISNRLAGRFASSEGAVHALSNWVLDQVLD